MKPCCYASVCKCTECNSPYYKECSKFVRAHVAYLTRSIRPFKMAHQSFSQTSVWSTDVNKAKSAAAQYAMKRNAEIKKYTISQVLSLVIDGGDITGSVIYVEAPQRISGDTEKVTKVLQSFVDKVTLSGGYISLYLNPASCLRLPDVTKL